MIFKDKQSNEVDAWRVSKDDVTQVERFDAQGIGAEYAMVFFNTCFLTPGGINDEG